MDEQAGGNRAKPIYGGVSEWSCRRFFLNEIPYTQYKQLHFRGENACDGQHKSSPATAAREGSIEEGASLCQKCAVL